MLATTHIEAIEDEEATTNAEDRILRLADMETAVKTATAIETIEEAAIKDMAIDIHERIAILGQEDAKETTDATLEIEATLEAPEATPLPETFIDNHQHLHTLDKRTVIETKAATKGPTTDKIEEDLLLAPMIAATIEDLIEDMIVDTSVVTIVDHPLEEMKMA